MILNLNKKCGALLFLTCAAVAHAGESPFGYIYTAETTPARHWEYEQWNTLRTGQGRGRYTAFDVSSEFEAGLTDKLQASIYLNGSYLHTRSAADPGDASKTLSDRSDFNVNGWSVEVVYQILNPYKDPVGLAFYLEPEISARDGHTGENEIERSLETRVILQKNFLEDQLITAANLVLEPEWEKDEGNNVRKLSAQWSLGASLRLRRRLSAGIELRNALEYADMNTGHVSSSAFFAGPTLHYGGENSWWTLAVQPQAYGRPENPELTRHEKLEVRFKLGIPFGGGDKS